MANVDPSGHGGDCGGDGDNWQPPPGCQTRGMDAQRQFVSKHNVRVNLDLTQPKTEYYHPMFTFLRRSRVNHVLTNSPILMTAYIRQFWDTAKLDNSVNPPVIRAQVANQDIAFSSDDLRVILSLGTREQDDGPTEFSLALRMGAFKRMGYVCDPTQSPYTKSYLYGQWRYLAHVMIMSLSSRKADWEAINAKLQSCIIALVYNKPYSFSRYFFDEFKHQIEATGRERFLLYPRFVMMIINHSVPNLPVVEKTDEVASIDQRVYTDFQRFRAKKPVNQRTQETALFGHIVNENYVAPPNDVWEDVPQADAQVVQQEPLEVIENVFQQLEQPEKEVVDPEIAEAVVQEAIQQGMTARRFVSRHNYRINLSPMQPGTEYYHPVFEFLRHSRVNHVLTNSPTLYLTYIEQFWNTATYVGNLNPPVIQARVADVSFQFSAADLREILHLGTVQQEAGPTRFPRELRSGAFRRMGFVGDTSRGTYFKGDLHGRWRYLSHVLIVALSNKKTGYDTLNVETQSQVIALVYNKPYSFSQFFFNEIRRQIGAREKFLMYPRFVMMIINTHIPNLPQVGRTVEVVVGMGKRTYKDFTTYFENKRVERRPQAVDLFGALVDANYQAPLNNGWEDVAREGAVGDVIELDHVEDPVHAVDEVRNDADVQDEVNNDDDVRNDGEATDSDSDGHGDVPDYLEVSGRLERVGNKPVVRPSIPPTESSSCGKRKVTEDDDCTPTSEGIQDVDEDTIQPRRSKRLRQTGGIIISEPTEPATTARTAAATTKEIPVTTSSPTRITIPTTTPTANIPSSSVSESSRIAVLEAQVASLTEQVATSLAQVTSLSTQVEKLNQLVMDQRRLAVAQEEKIQGLEEFAEAQSSVFSKLKSSFVKASDLVNNIR